MTGYRIAPNNVRVTREFLREIVNVVNGIMRGKQNNRGDVTLTENQTTTAVTDVRISGQSVILLMPLTANAAGESPHISTSDGSMTITHANAATTDREFRYVIFG